MRVLWLLLFLSAAPLWAQAQEQDSETASKASEAVSEAAAVNAPASNSPVSSITDSSGLALSESSASPVAQSSEVVSSTTHLGQVLAALLFVIGLIFALAWFFKRVGHGSLVGSKHIKLIANMPLGTRERVALVEVGGKQLLLGVTTQQINTLHTFEQPVVDVESTKELSDFGKKIQEIISRSGTQGK